MIFFGHTGITVGAVHAVNRKWGLKIDLRWAALAAIGPDLIDKPIALLYPNVFGKHTRLFGHSLLIAFIVLTLFWALRRRVRIPFAYWGCFVGHLFLDRMWQSNIHFLLWPALGYPPPMQDEILRRWWESLFQSFSMFGEFLGLGILLYLVARYRLYRPAQLRAFWKKGLLDESVREA